MGVHRTAWRVGAVVVSLALCGLGELPAGAGVSGRHHVVANADSTGPIVVNSKGVGYLAWERRTSGTDGDAIVFCRIPRGGSCQHQRVLPLPSGAHWDDYDVIQPFPVLGGKADTVLVVGPSYNRSDVVVWTSHNSGTSFSEPQVIGDSSYADNTAVDDVRRAPNNPTTSLNYFSIASHNTGLGYSWTGTGTIGAMDPPSGFKFDTDAVPGQVAGATLGFSGKHTIEAFWTDSAKPRLAYFWSPVAGVSGSPGTSEHGPIAVTDGANARLAGGSKGLFLLSADDGSTASKPLSLDVRRWKPSTHSFVARHHVAPIRNDANASNQGGFTEDVSNGDLVVAWPGYNAHGVYVMKVWVSTDGGSSFTGPTVVSTIDGGYAGPARIAARGADGFLTFQDDRGLNVVDLTGL
jgi:hypothetical protein